MGDMGGWLSSITENVVTGGMSIPFQMNAEFANLFGSNTLFGGFFKQLSDNDLLRNANLQALENTQNWITGKENFGSHKNWVGGGIAGDIINPLFGGQSQAEADAEEKDKAIYDAWLANKEKKKLPEGIDLNKPILAQGDEDLLS